MSHRKGSKSLVTDNKTDLMFGNYANEVKLNEQLRAEFENPSEMKRYMNKSNPKMSTKITDSEYKNTMGTNGSKNKSDKRGSLSDSSESSELPSNTSYTSDKKKVKGSGVEFNDSNSDSDSGSTSGSGSGSGSASASDSNSDAGPQIKSPFRNKIDAKTKSDANKNIFMPQTQSTQSTQIGQTGQTGQTGQSAQQMPVPEVPKKRIETPEERRIRTRSAYSTLQDLETKGVRLNKRYSPDDDVDDMEAEIAAQREKRNKQNQVNFYKKTLLTIVCGVEFLNEKYDPFAFKLRDWSKHVASEQDEYVEILEELYEKYKDRGGRMAPEIKLLLMIVMSAVTFHLSQTLFGPAGMKDAMKSNPNVLAQMMKTFTGSGKGSDEPAEARSTKPNNQHVMDLINKRNQATQRNAQTPAGNLRLDSDSDSDSESNTQSNRQSQTDLLREKHALEERQAQLDRQAKRQEETFKVRMEQLRQREEQTIKQNQHMQERLNQLEQNQRSNSIGQNQGQNSRSNQRPNQRPNQTQTQTQTHTIKITNPLPYDENSSASSEVDIGIDIKSPTIKSASKTIRQTPKPKSVAATTKSNTAKNKSAGYEDLLESLDESSELDMSDIMRSATKRSKSKSINPTASISKRRGSDSASDGLSTVSRRKATVIKL